MEPSHETKTSKFLSLILRHSPQTIDITLDSAGWVDTEELLVQCNRHGTRLTREILETIVKNSGLPSTKIIRAYGLTKDIPYR